MPSTGSSTYDDLLLIEEQQKEKETSGSLSPFTYLCIALITALYGLVILYSSSYSEALSNGLAHYWYFVRNLYAGVAGLLLGIATRFLGMRRIKKLYLIFMPLSLIALVLQSIPVFEGDFHLVIGGIQLFSAPSFAMFSLILIISALFPSREKRGSYFLPSAVIVIYLTLVLFSGGIGWYILGVILTIILLRVKGVSIVALILAFLFSIAVLCGISFIYPDLLAPVFESIMPVSDASFYNQALVASRSAIADGGISGAGLGKGIYKLGTLPSPEGMFIFSSLAEETGMTGMLFVLILFFLIGILGYRSSRRLRRKGEADSAVIAIGLSFYIVFRAYMNMLYCMGILPFPGISMPFFSYDIWEEGLTVFSAVLLYRFIYASGREVKDAKK